MVLFIFSKRPSNANNNLTRNQLQLVFSTPAQGLNRVLFQIDIAVVGGAQGLWGCRRAMAPGDTQTVGGKGVPGGPALRGASGGRHDKSAKGANGGELGGRRVSRQLGALVGAQGAGASWASGKATTLTPLSHIVGGADPSSEPPAGHPTYDKMNRTVQGLPRGAALPSHAMGVGEGLRGLPPGCTEGVDYQAPNGGTPALISA